MHTNKYNDYFGTYGGRYVAEVLRAPLTELEEQFLAAAGDDDFHKQFDDLAATYIGRPTPLLAAENATQAAGGGRMYIKQEGLAQTGAHKINNAAGQALLAKRMGKRRIIAETGAGQHGVAAAAVCAKLGLSCTVYMGEVDIQRQRPNVFWMELFGAEVVPVATGSRTLKDAINAALRDWASSFKDTHYLIGSALGPSPYPAMVKQFQSVIGRETEEQIRQQNIDVHALVACVGGGSNAIGFFTPFLDLPAPRLIGAEAGGKGSGLGEHASRMTGKGSCGIVHGYKSMFLLDDDGQVQPTHSISAGLDYPGIGPELAHYGDTGRIEFVRVGDTEALEALTFFARHEGIIFALESAHGAAAALRAAREVSPEQAVVVNMSGRGEKDLFITAAALSRSRHDETWRSFLVEEANRLGGTAAGTAAMAGPVSEVFAHD